jgi:hypothetical protein
MKASEAGSRKYKCTDMHKLCFGTMYAHPCNVTFMQGVGTYVYTWSSYCTHAHLMHVYVQNIDSFYTRDSSRRSKMHQKGRKTFLHTPAYIYSVETGAQHSTHVQS